MDYGSTIGNKEEELYKWRQGIPIQENGGTVKSMGKEYIDLGTMISTRDSLWMV